MERIPLEDFLFDTAREYSLSRIQFVSQVSLFNMEHF
jgi:hypothetical protein